MADTDRRIELVRRPGPAELEARAVAIGLLVGLAVGHRSLIAAVTGRSAYERALGYFVVTVLVSVAGALLIGTLYQRFVGRHPNPGDGRDDRASIPDRGTNEPGADERPAADAENTR